MLCIYLKNLLMKKKTPEPPGVGSITISCDLNGTEVHTTDMPVYVLVHLFYMAIKEIPSGFIAADAAMNKYLNENIS